MAATWLLTRVSSLEDYNPITTDCCHGPWLIVCRLFNASQSWVSTSGAFLRVISAPVFQFVIAGVVQALTYKTSNKYLVSLLHLWSQGGLGLG